MSELVQRRPWFRFSLRTLFVLTTLVALGLGWLAYQMAWVQKRRSGREWINAHLLRGSVRSQVESEAEFPWPLWLLGDEPLDQILSVRARFEEWDDLPGFRRQLLQIQGLFPEAQIVEDDYWDRMPNPEQTIKEIRELRAATQANQGQ